MSQQEGVAESAVIGLPDEKWGERPYALVVLKPDYADKVTAQGIRDVMQAKATAGELNKWYVPDRIVFVTEIPKTSVGKIDKKRIRGEMKETLLNG